MVKQVKKTTKKPPAAADDTRKEIMIAFNVAANKKNMQIISPVNARRVIVPTCQAAKTTVSCSQFECK